MGPTDSRLLESSRTYRSSKLFEDGFPIFGRAVYALSLAAAQGQYLGRVTFTIRYEVHCWFATDGFTSWCASLYHRGLMTDGATLNSVSPGMQTCVSLLYELTSGCEKKYGREWSVEEQRILNLRIYQIELLLVAKDWHRARANRQIDRCLHTASDEKYI